MPHPARRGAHHTFALRLAACIVSWSLILSSATAELSNAGPPLPKGHVHVQIANLSAGNTARLVQQGTVPQSSPQQDTDIDCNNSTDGNSELANILNVMPGRPNEEASKWGDITIAQPKIWQFERVSALLDGLLRDLEGVSLSDLTQLDPNKQNAAALTFIQQALEVGVQYDQAAAVNNRNILQGYDALHNSQLQQLDQYNAYTQTLAAERDRLASQLVAATNEVDNLQPLQDDGTIGLGQATQLAAAISRQKAAQTSLTNVNSLISGAGAALTLTPPPTVTGTSVQAPASGSSMASSLSGFADVLKSLPSGLTTNLNAGLQNPTYPTTKQLDNFITLLYERLAREVSALQDDLTRDPENTAFLLQFDVGLYPADRARDRVARVEFNIDCPGCKVYSLYPGQSAYNLANYSGASKRMTLWGNVLTLIGFGLSASYRRQVDTLHGSLVQSVYTAGFQNGIMDENNIDNHPDGSHWIPDNSRAEQSFGWYYGPAPFEKLVSPGIRSTFALITVPSKLIRGARDGFGNTNACLAFHINGAWANRNDPLAEHYYVSPPKEAGKVLRVPIYDPYRRQLEKPFAEPKPDNKGYVNGYLPSVTTKMTSVRLPAAPDDIPLVAQRERQKLHVLRMEYNTVDEDPPPIATNSSINPIPIPAARSATLSSIPSAASQAAAATQTASLDPLPCPKKQCAAMLLKFDRPIDPNLAITVRGKPLARVRDWRGRATSVLPPAQSGSDILASASAALKQGLQQNSALLETDYLGANTWFALNSHELILIVSKEVATNYEFPVIQIVDARGSVVIPHDLRRNVTELIVNGFRLSALTEKGIRTDARLNFWQGDGYPPAILADGPITTGPYPFSTYLPLFLPEPGARSFSVLMGDTGEDLLIGFLPQRSDRNAGARKHYSWSEAHTQVILEDRDLDFAWSLSCAAQGESLACRYPRQEVSRAYYNYLLACQESQTNEDQCPAAQAKRPSIRLASSFGGTVPQRTDSAGPVASLREFSRGQKSELVATRLPNRTVSSKEETGSGNWLLTDASDQVKSSDRNLDKGPHQFTTTMELWVEQFDPDGNERFYSPEPAKINYLPVSKDYWPANLKQNGFMPWRFNGANKDRVDVVGCMYYPGSEGKIAIKILGAPQRIDLSSDAKNATAAKGEEQNYFEINSGTSCDEFPVTTAMLAGEQIVFEMKFPDSSQNISKAPAPSKPNVQKMRFKMPATDESSLEDTNSDASVSRIMQTTIALPTALLRPHFGEAEVRPDVEQVAASNGTQRFQVVGWDVYIPVSRTTPVDDVELPEGLLARSHASSRGPVTVEWLVGDKPACRQDYTMPNCVAVADWKEQEDTGNLRLHLKVSRQGLRELPERLYITRTTGTGLKVKVADLPDLRELMLPLGLSLQSLSGTQFVLRGKNAAVIDAVSLQSGTSAYFEPTASGVDFALVTLPTASESSSSTDNSGGGGGNAGNSSTQITVDTTKDNTGHVVMNTQSSTTPAKAPATAKNPTDAPPQGNTTSGAKALVPGSYAVIPLIEVGTTAPETRELKANATTTAMALAAAQKKQTEAENNLKAAKPAEVPERQKELKDVKEVVTKAQDAASEAKKAFDDRQKLETDAKTTAAALTAAQKEESDAEVKSKAAPADATLQDKVKKAQGDLAKAQSATTAAKTALANAEPNPIYMPLSVTDDQGKPLIFTVADPKKQTVNTLASTPPSTATSCIPACVLMPCAASCPPASSQTVAPKSQ